MSFPQKSTVPRVMNSVPVYMTRIPRVQLAIGKKRGKLLSVGRE